MSEKEDNSMPERPFGQAKKVEFKGQGVKVRKGKAAKSTQVQRDRTKYARASERRAHTNEEETE